MSFSTIQWGRIVRPYKGRIVRGANCPGGESVWANRPGASRPEASRPGANRPGANRPGANRPGANRPGTINVCPR